MNYKHVSLPLRPEDKERSWLDISSSWLFYEPRKEEEKSFYVLSTYNALSIFTYFISFSLKKKKVLGWQLCFWVLHLMRAEEREGGEGGIGSFSDLRGGVLQVKGTNRRLTSLKSVNLNEFYSFPFFNRKKFVHSAVFSNKTVVSFLLPTRIFTFSWACVIILKQIFTLGSDVKGLSHMYLKF